MNTITPGTHGLIIHYQNFVPVYLPVTVMEVRGDWMYCLADDGQRHYFNRLMEPARGIWLEQDSPLFTQ